MFIKLLTRHPAIISAADEASISPCVDSMRTQNKKESISQSHRVRHSRAGEEEAFERAKAAKVGITWKNESSVLLAAVLLATVQPATGRPTRLRGNCRDA